MNFKSILVGKIMKKSRLLGVVSTFLFSMSFFALISPVAKASTWDITTDYSSVNNPNGVWEYGRKFTVESNAFDLMLFRWDSTGTVPSGGIGWYMGNWGHGAPGMLDGNGTTVGPRLWAKDNSNGMAVVRWTSPQAGSYSVDALFTGADSRGVDNFVYVAVNDSMVFSDRVSFNLDTAGYSVGNISLQAGDHVDFMIAWAGGVNSEYGWTEVEGTISAVPVPAAAWLFGSGLIGLIGFARRKSN